MKNHFLRLILSVLALVVAGSALGQWSPPPPFETVDVPAVNCPTIVAGTILEAKSDAKDWTWRDLTVAVKDALKGDIPVGKPATLHLCSPVRQEEVERWKVQGDFVLVAVSGDPHQYSTLIDLSSKDLAVFSADLKLLRRPEDVLRVVRDEVRTAKEENVKPGKYARLVPASVIVGSPLEHGAYITPEHEVRFNVPLDKRLERFGQKEVWAERPADRYNGIFLLQNFNSPENIATLRRLLNDDRWVQSSTYLNNLTLVFRTNEVPGLAWMVLRNLGLPAKYPTNMVPSNFNDQVVSADAAPDLPSQLAELPKYPNLIDYCLAGAALYHGFFDELVRLKGLRMLYFQSSNLDDQGLKRLAALPNLAYLNLANTQVTDKGLLELAAFKKLKRVDLGPEISDEGVAALRRARPDMTVQPDEFKFLQALHPRQRVEISLGGRPAHNPDGASPEVWRYGLVIPGMYAGQLDALLSEKLRRGGWVAGSVGTGKGYRRVRARLSGADHGVLVDSVQVPDKGSGFEGDPGERMIIISRTIEIQPNGQPMEPTKPPLRFGDVG